MLASLELAQLRHLHLELLLLDAQLLLRLLLAGYVTTTGDLLDKDLVDVLFDGGFGLAGILRAHVVVELGVP